MPRTGARFTSDVSQLIFPFLDLDIKYRCWVAPEDVTIYPSLGTLICRFRIAIRRTTRSAPFRIGNPSQSNRTFQ